MIRLRRFATSFVTPRLRDYLEKVCAQNAVLNQRLNDPDILPKEMAQLGKKISEYCDLVNCYREYLKSEETLSSLGEMLKSEKDATMHELIRDEIQQAERQIPILEGNIRDLLVRPDTEDRGSAVMEVRPAAGGDEAAIFAAELLKVYKVYCENKGWSFETVDLSDDENGGVREAVVNITGEGVFGKLRWESGVHRVQRVPKTESQDRVHTSTVTVAILPQCEDIEVEIDEKDLRIESFRSRGPGGQHVNTTSSAVRVVHNPTGIAIVVRDGRCAQQNKLQALTILRSRLYDIERSKQQASIKTSRKSQIGTGDRNEKIRTFNFPQTRITDHRLGLSIHNMESFYAATHIDGFGEQLRHLEEQHRLASIHLDD